MYPVLMKLAQPFTIGLVVLGVALIAVWRRKPERRRALGFAAFAYVLLVLASFNPVAHVVLAALEDQTAPLTEPPADVSALVVLGGGGHSLARCERAASLYRPAIHALVLASGGHPDPNDPIEAEQMRDWLVRLGVPATVVVVESESNSTHENAVHCAAILRDRGMSKVVLVTDAVHMPRAIACFRKQGIDVVPAPCDRITDHRPRVPGYFVPSAGAAERTERGVREWLGMLWYWVNGRI